MSEPEPRPRTAAEMRAGKPPLTPREKALRKERIFRGIEDPSLGTSSGGSMTPEPVGTAPIGAAETPAAGAGSKREWGQRITDLPKNILRTLIDRKDIRANIITAAGLACIRAGIVWGTGQQLELIDSAVYGAIAGGIRSAVTERYKSSQDKMGMGKAVFDGMFWGAVGAGIGAVGQAHSMDTSGYNPFGFSPIESNLGRVLYGAGIGAASGLLNRTREVIKSKGEGFQSKRTLWSAVIGAVIGGGIVGAKELVDYTIFGVGRAPSAPAAPPIEPQGAPAKPGIEVEKPSGSPGLAPTIIEEQAPPPSPSPVSSPNAEPVRQPVRVPDTLPTPVRRVPLPDILPSPIPRSAVPVDELSAAMMATTDNGSAPLSADQGVFMSMKTVSPIEVNQVLDPESVLGRYIDGLKNKSVHLEPEIHSKLSEEVAKGNTSFLGSPEANELINSPTNDVINLEKEDVFSPPGIGPEWSSLKGKVEAWIGQDFFDNPDPRVIAEIEERMKKEGISLWHNEIIDDIKRGSVGTFDPYNADHAEILKLIRESKTGGPLFDKEFLGAYLAVKLDNPETGGPGTGIFNEKNSDYFKHKTPVKIKQPGAFMETLRKIR